MGPSHLHEDVVEGGAASGYAFDAALGRLAAFDPGAVAAPTGMDTVYSCHLASGVEVTSRYSTCEGLGATGVPQGYIWQTAAAVPSGNSVYLYRCTVGSDYFDSTSSTCGSANVRGSGLGYLDTTGAAATATAAVNTTKSFTVSAWLKPGLSAVASRSYAALAQSGAGGSAFWLGYTAGAAHAYTFCVRSQQTPSVNDCASVSGTAGQWALVTGVWDAANGQVRILIGDDINPGAVTPHAVDVGVAPSGPLYVGAAPVNGSVANEWSGEIADPIVFPCVISQLQLDSVFTHQYSNFDPAV